MKLLTRNPPWSPRNWVRAVYLAAGIPVLAATPLLVALGVAATRGALLPFALVLVFLIVPMLTSIQRSRLRTTTGLDIARQPAWQLTLTGLKAAVLTRSTWRQLAYHLLAAPLLAAAAIAAVGAWIAGLMFASIYAYGWDLPRTALLGHGEASRLTSKFISAPVDVYVTVGGIALLLLAPALTKGVSRLDQMVARELLGPNRADELEHRVERLAETRAGVVDAADAERRRLERDLHDGTQQRLVSLAMNLGMARAQVSSAAEAHEAIAEAHEEAKAALSELRNLVRGLHPAVLEDRGLDAALSGVAARLPIPVRLTVDVPHRPVPTIEAVAYFVVSEGLSNIAKHAQASQAEVFVQRVGERLHIIVTDDGVGGADTERGTGLTGLAKRAESVDGTFELVSPPGGPTLITVDLPCTR